METNHEMLAKSALIGFAVGDALGVPGEFMRPEELAEDPITGMRGGGAHGQEPGTWSDDTSMTLCQMVSLSLNGVDYEDLMRRFCEWLWEAKYTARGEVFDVGGTVKSALFNYSRGKAALDCGEDGEHSCGNGSLMRILPAALYLYFRGHGTLSRRSMRTIHDLSRVTHAHPRCLMACGIYCAVVWEVLGGAELKAAVRQGVQKALEYYAEQPGFEGACEDYASLSSIDTWPDSEVSGRGYVVTTLQAVLWGLATTDSYESCVLKLVNLGHDADTTAAIAGGVAGLYYGMDAIPFNWREELAMEPELEKLAGIFAQMVTKKRVKGD